MNPNKMIFDTQNEGGSIKLKIDPAMFEQLRNSKGFIPVIIDMKSMLDLSTFLGIIAK